MHGKFQKPQTDITEFLKNGGVITHGKTKRAKGSEQILYYSLDSGLKPILHKKVQLPSHFGRTKQEFYKPDPKPTVDSCFVKPSFVINGSRRESRD